VRHEFHEIIALRMNLIDVNPVTLFTVDLSPSGLQNCRSLLKVIIAQKRVLLGCTCINNSYDQFKWFSTVV
jgi:hypothetical protein